ncbi:hypothetical protein [Phytoactinopolyspora endophytica]|uniref:hypothetical protein n=1 Tax=Phytoactinopolyspora endophytica TaxID=1642495 RepID=UPI00101D4410|nr:hypothetical protein [Phytoactinopolyspora endophytica]
MTSTVSVEELAPVERTYTSTATKVDDRWSVRCDQRPDIDTTAKQLDHAVAEHRRVLAEMLEVAEDKLNVIVRPVVPQLAQEHIDRARELRQTAAWAKAEAAAEARSAARGLHDMKVSLRDIGTILGVSHQRAHQLVSEHPGGSDTSRN